MMPRTLLGLVLVLWSMVAPGVAHASLTVAVLPLSQGAGSDDYAGFGDAMAGMIVSDLARAPGLTLVERTRLDELLAEIELGESGFVEAGSAQQLGRGVGAQLVLVGSYSVIGADLLLDARLVRVESGEVLEAADSQGGVGDFVAVEKELVEELLQRLEVKLSAGERRQLMVAAPTESFEAFASYGQGLHLRREGDLAGAQEAFSAAVRVDPAFEDARQALSDLRARLESVAEERALARNAVLDGAFKRVIAESPAPRDLKKVDLEDGDVHAKLMVRFGVLESAGLHCQLQEELTDFLILTKGQVKPPQTSPVVGYRMRGFIEQWELDTTVLREHDRELGFDQSFQERVGERHKDPVRFVLDKHRHGNHRVIHHGLVDVARRCHGRDAWVGELEQIRKLVDRLDIGTLEQDRGNGLPLEPALTLTWAWIRVSLQGLDGEVQGELDRLIDQVQGTEDEAAVIQKIEMLADRAEIVAHARARQGGRPPEELEAHMRMAVARDPEALLLDAPRCEVALQLMGTMIDIWPGRHEKALEAEPFESLRLSLDSSWSQAAMVVLPLQDLGCYRGQPGRFESLEATVAYARGVKERADPEYGKTSTCITTFGAVDGMVRSVDATLQYGGNESVIANLHLGMVRLLRSLESERCVPVEAR